MILVSFIGKVQRVRKQHGKDKMRKVFGVDKGDGTIPGLLLSATYS